MIKAVLFSFKQLYLYLCYSMFRIQTLKQIISLSLPLRYWFRVVFIIYRTREHISLFHSLEVRHCCWHFKTFGIILGMLIIVEGFRLTLREELLEGPQLDSNQSLHVYMHGQIRMIQQNTHTLNPYSFYILPLVLSSWQNQHVCMNVCMNI